MSRVPTPNSSDPSARLYGAFRSSPNGVTDPASELDGPRLVRHVPEDLGDDGQPDDDEAGVDLPDGPDGDGAEGVGVVFSRPEEQDVVVDAGDRGRAGATL